MNKVPIGIIDVGCEGFIVLEELMKNLKNEDFIYINDLKNYPYEGNDPLVIEKMVREKINFLLMQNIKMLIVVSDTIVEYCEKYLETLSIPVINIVQSIINYVMNKYEQKNLILLAKDYIIKANLYQKNFKYNHLSSLDSKPLENIILNHQIKTSKSFVTTKETFRQAGKRDIDLLILTAPYLSLLNTEFLEYIDFEEVLNVGKLFTEEIKKNPSILLNKGRGHLFIMSNVEKNIFQEKTYWFNSKQKYKYYNLSNQKILNKLSLVKQTN